LPASCCWNLRWPEMVRVWFSTRTVVDSRASGDQFAKPKGLTTGVPGLLQSAILLNLAILSRRQSLYSATFFLGGGGSSPLGA
jgi:hypothetical protein